MWRHPILDVYKRQTRFPDNGGFVLWVLSAEQPFIRFRERLAGFLCM